MSDLEGELERRTLTYTLWNQSATKMEKKGWHPFTFNFANAGLKQIKEIKVVMTAHFPLFFYFIFNFMNKRPLLLILSIQKMNIEMGTRCDFLI